MKIAVIGTGNIGTTLGTKWVAAGHDVVYGTRSNAGTVAGAPARPVAGAIGGADVVVLAVPGTAVGEVVAAAGDSLTGKVVIDAANRIGANAFDSRAAVTAAAPDALYVRAFNSLGWENFADAPDGADLFFAADPRARATAENLIGAVGLHPVYVGEVDATDIVDSLLPLWFALVKQHGGNRRLALRVVQ